MLLTKSITNTKKFFQKSIDGLKSLFSGGHYQKLPKSDHPYSYPDVFSHSNVGTNMISDKSFKNHDLDKVCGDVSERWRNYDEEKEKKTEKKKTRSSSSPSSAISTTRSVTKQERDHDLIGNYMRYSPASPAKNFQVKTREDYTYNNNNKQRNIYAGKRSKQENNSGSKGNTTEARSLLVAQQLKELQMMDANNVDHELDIEEVLYYYTRLSCPAYVELVDRFFMEIYAEFFAPPAVTPLVTKSRQLVR